MSVSIQVKLQYGGSKVRITSRPIESVIATVRHDLSTLQLDQPSSDSIKVTGLGHIEFSWNFAQKNGTLHSSLEQKLNPSSPSSILRSNPERLCSLSITGLEFHVNESDKPPSRQQNIPTNEFWIRDSISIPSSQRDFDMSALAGHNTGLAERNNEEQDTLDNGPERQTETYWVYSDGMKTSVAQNLRSIQTQTLPRIRRYAPSPRVPAEEKSSVHVIRGRINEPRVDALIIRRRSGSNSSIASGSEWKTPAECPLHLKDAVVNETLPKDTTSESDMDRGITTPKADTSLPRGTKRSRSFSQDGRVSESALSPFTFAVNGSLQLADTIPNSSDFSFNPVSGSKHERAESSYELAAQHNRSQSNSSDSVSKHQNDNPLPEARIAKLIPKQPISDALKYGFKPQATKVGDDPLAHKLSSELLALQKEKNAGSARQKAILDELRKIGAEDAILKPMLAVVDTKSEADLGAEVAKVRLRSVENKVKMERKRRNEIMLELKDIEKQGREPFIVPALLDAFISLSKLTTDVKRELPSASSGRGK